MRTFVIAGALALGLASLPLTAADAGSAWRVTIKASTHQVAAGKAVVFTGKVRPGSSAGKKVVLQEKFKPGKPWVSQKNAPIQADGTYQVKDKPTLTTVHRYRVVMPGARHHNKGVSPVVKVTVYAWTLLSQQTAVNDTSMGFGTVPINGTSYLDSIWNRFGTSGSIEFNVNHKCIKVRSVFGLSDNSTTAGQGEVSIESDGASIYSNTFDVGQSQERTLSLTPAPLKLRLEAHDTSTTSGAVGHGAFGGPEVLCTS